jgi:hypothetical protein
LVFTEPGKRAADFKKQLAELQFAFNGLTSQVGIAMIPALSRIVDIFKGWMESNREWIGMGLEALMGGIVNGFERFWKVLKNLTGIFDPLIEAIKPFGWQNTELHTLFQGSVLSAVSERNGADIVTKIGALPGYGALVRGVSSKTFSAGTPVRDVVKNMAQDFSVRLPEASTPPARATRTTITTWCRPTSASPSCRCSAASSTGLEPPSGAGRTGPPVPPSWKCTTRASRP